MDSITERIDLVNQRIESAAKRWGKSADTIHLIAVSKTRPAEEILSAHGAGQRHFGENYLQDALEKMGILTDVDITWHFIGPIQSNKTRPIAENFDWVHSVDRLKIAQRLSSQRPASLGPLNVCLQINVSGEASKSGISVNEIHSLASATASLPNIRLRGLMAIPAPSKNFDEQRDSFRQMHELYQLLRGKGLALDTLSMGMSSDLEAAIAEGSTMVRIGTAIFGPREK